MSDRYLTTAEVARILRYRSAKHVADLCRQNKLPGVQIAGRWLIDRQRLETLLDRPPATGNIRTAKPTHYVTTGIRDQVRAM